MIVWSRRSLQVREEKRSEHDGDNSANYSLHIPVKMMHKHVTRKLYEQRI